MAGRQIDRQVVDRVLGDGATRYNSGCGVGLALAACDDERMVATIRFLLSEPSARTAAIAREMGSAGMVDPRTGNRLTPVTLGRHRRHECDCDRAGL